MLHIGPNGLCYERKTTTTSTSTSTSVRVNHHHNHKHNSNYKEQKHQQVTLHHQPSPHPKTTTTKVIPRNDVATAPPRLTFDEIRQITQHQQLYCETQYPELKTNPKGKGKGKPTQNQAPTPSFHCKRTKNNISSETKMTQNSS